MNRDFKSMLQTIPGYDPFRDAEDFWFDEPAAQTVLDYFSECIRHTKGKLRGQTVKLEKWQQAIFANLFGWKRKDGTRRYREVFVFIPRKNGKTTLAAGLACFVLFCDGEPGAEIYSAAAERDQAALSFDIAKNMVLQDPDMSASAEIFTKAIVYRDSSYKAISADANTKHGYNSHLVIDDELHAQPNRDLIDVLITSTGSRSQPIIFHITTSDFERKSICNEKHEYACQVRDGVVPDPAFLPVIYEATTSDDWRDPKVWARANPNLGVSISHEYLERECERAKASPEYENTFKRLHLNIRTEQESRWLSMELWNSNGDANPIQWRKDRLEQFMGCQAASGLDLGSTSDLTALALIFKDEGKSYVLPWFWVPEDGDWTSNRAIRPFYEQWIREGFVTATPGNTCDYEWVLEDILEVADNYGLPGTWVDRAFQGAHLMTLMAGEGLEVVSCPQNYSMMTAPCVELEKRLADGTLLHGGNPVLRWMAANVALQRDASGKLCRPVKPRHGHKWAKIDGIVATVMALGSLIRRDENQGKSVYDERGILML